MIDLHAHTNISDGTASPEEIIQIAKSTGLSAVAITDHDSIDGLNIAQREAERTGVRLVKGIEFSAAYGVDRIIHILGLGIEPQSVGFMTVYSQFRQERSFRLDHVFKKLKSMGVRIEREDVEPYKTGGYTDRQAIAKYLIGEGYAPSIHSAWMNYLDKIDYIDGELIAPETAFSAIHAAGGKAFLAHFHLPIGLKGYSDVEAFLHLKKLKEMGLDGMEYYYPSYSPKDKLRCAQFIEAFDFIKSGGTDFHGENRAHIKLGTGEGDFAVPDSLLDEILPGVSA